MGGLIARLFPSWSYSVLRTERKQNRLSEVVQLRLDELDKREEELNQETAAYEEQLRAHMLAKQLLSAKVKGEKRKETLSERREAKRSLYRIALLTDHLKRCENEFDLLMEARVDAEEKRPSKSQDRVLSNEAFIKFNRDFKQFKSKSSVRTQEEQDRALHDIAMDMEVVDTGAASAPGRDALHAALRKGFAFNDADVDAMFALDGDEAAASADAGGAVEIVESAAPALPVMLMD